MADVLPAHSSAALTKRREARKAASHSATGAERLP